MHYLDNLSRLYLNLIGSEYYPDYFLRHHWQTLNVTHGKKIILLRLVETGHGNVSFTFFFSNV